MFDIRTIFYYNKKLEISESNKSSLEKEINNKMEII